MAFTLAFAGCAGTKPVPLTRTMAELHPVSTTGVDTAVAGWANFTEKSGIVTIIITVRNLTAGDHGTHVHAGTSCEPGPGNAANQTVVAAGAAGGHFNPTNATHGQHAGDLGNLNVAANGRGVLTLSRSNFNLQTDDPLSVMGRTVVIHANRDDGMTDPAGKSGPRVLCGIIQAA